jgi:succinate dehydrogenase / fumarate reductase cytochrome b subunit
MLYSGLLILIFVFLHVRMFKYGDRGSGTLYDLVTATFRSTGYRTAYVLAMAVLGFHLYHAFQSAFQTLSIHSPTLRRLCLLVSLALALGFGLIPLYVGLLM